MPALNTYIRNEIDRPLRKLSKKTGLTRGAIINNLLKEKLKKEGLI